MTIKLAVDAGDFERAAALLEVARRTTKLPAIVVPLRAVRDGGEREK